MLMLGDLNPLMDLLINDSSKILWLTCTPSMAQQFAMAQWLKTTAVTCNRNQLTVAFGALCSDSLITRFPLSTQPVQNGLRDPMVGIEWEVS